MQALVRAARSHVPEAHLRCEAVDNFVGVVRGCITFAEFEARNRAGPAWAAYVKKYWYAERWWGLTSSGFRDLIDVVLTKTCVRPTAPCCAACPNHSSPHTAASLPSFAAPTASSRPCSP